MHHIMVCGNTPSKFVEANYKELSGLIRAMCQRFELPEWEDVLSDFVAELLEGRHQYDREKTGVHNLPAAVTTYMYSVVRFFVMNWKNKRVQEEGRYDDLDIETVAVDDFSEEIEVAEIYRKIRKGLHQAAMGAGMRNRLLTIVNLIHNDIGVNEIARILEVSNALISYHVRAIRLFGRHALAGRSPQEAWNLARPALVGKLAGN